MTAPKILPVLATHGGKFHCDEVFAYLVLRLALGLKAPGEDHTLLRTRKAALIDAADIVWDVGGVFDAAGGDGGSGCGVCAFAKVRSGGEDAGRGLGIDEICDGRSGE